jgi:hypothetical protein
VKANLSEAELEHLSGEHSSLAGKQNEALERSIYIRMTVTEAGEYDRRRLRIGELCQILAAFRTQKPFQR